MRLINIGFGNMVSTDKVVAVVSPESAPIKRIVQEAKEKGTLIDATFGRRTKAVIITDCDSVVLSAILPETVAGRFNGKEDNASGEENGDACRLINCDFRTVWRWKRDDTQGAVRSRCKSQAIRIRYNASAEAGRRKWKTVLFYQSRRVSGSDKDRKNAGIY